MTYPLRCDRNLTLHRLPKQLADKGLLRIVVFDSTTNLIIDIMEVVHQPLIKMFNRLRKDLDHNSLRAEILEVP